MSARVTLPSGSTIAGPTWAAMRTDGTWAGWLDPGMYSDEDRAWMTRELSRDGRDA